MDDVSRPAAFDRHIDELRRRAAPIPSPPFEALMVNRPSPAALGDLASSQEVRLVTRAYGDVLDPDSPTVLVATAYGDHVIDVIDLLRAEVRRWTDAPGPVEVDGRMTVTIEGESRLATVLVQDHVAAVVPNEPRRAVVIVRGIEVAGLELVPCRSLVSYMVARKDHLDDLRRRCRDGRGPRRRR